MRIRRGINAAVLAAASLAPAAAQASFMSGDALDAMANFIAWIVLIFVPVGGIVLFWIVHVMPEKIAERNHHPQQQAIKTLCLLSLVFGGLLWPIAWLWAYTRPVAYRMAYGTDKHEEYFEAMAERARRGELDAGEMAQLEAELDAIESRGNLNAPQRALRVALGHARPAASPPAGAPKEGAA